MDGASVTNSLQALAVVGVALYGLRFALRWLTTHRVGDPRRQLRHIETCALGAKQRLHLVELDGEQLLLAATETQLRLVRRRPLAAKTLEEAPHPGEGARCETSPAVGTGVPTTAAGVGGFLRSTGRAERWRAFFGGGAGVLLWLLAPEAGAQSLTQLPDLVGAATEPGRISSTLELLMIMTLFSVAPSLLLMATCFTRVVIVLSLLRQALGVAQLPPNQVIVGLALAITVFAMAPVGAKIEREALNPYVEKEIEAPVALERAAGTLRGFLLQHTRERDLALFVSLSEDPPQNRDDVALFTLLPSFMLSEIRTAFEIGFTIFLPFLIVDLVIASMLISMQMIVLPPIVISLPFKLMLFVLLDGWNLVAGSLLEGLR